MSGIADASHTDADLMRRCRQGDGVAFAELVRRWQQPVARVVARLAGRADAVPDLCQEVFLRVYLARDRYRESGTFVAWLYRIAVNVARDHLRRHRFQPEPLGGQEPVADQPTAEAECVNDELGRVVVRAVAELPEPLREVVVLRHYEGMTFEEIGRVLGVPATTLKSRFAVSLDRLRQSLRPHGWGIEENQP